MNYRKEVIIKTSIALLIINRIWRDNLISVIIPTYNAEKYISRCIESVLEQTYKNFEIIIIDDKSTDDTANILKKYERLDNVTIITNKKNSGVSFSRNRGLKLSKGEFITFVDSDDFLPNFAFEYLANIILKYKADIVCGDFSERLPEQQFGNDLIIVENSEIDELIKNRITYQETNSVLNVVGYVWGKLYKKEVIDNCLFSEKVRFMEDTLFNLEVFQHCNRIAFSHQSCYVYKLNEDSTTHKFFENYSREIKRYLLLLEKKIKIKGVGEHEISVFGVYMYMNFLKHYAMHKNLENETRFRAISNTFNDIFWQKIFDSVDMRKLPIKYKILSLFYKWKVSYGIVVIYMLNEIKNRGVNQIISRKK